MHRCTICSERQENKSLVYGRRKIPDQSCLFVFLAWIFRIPMLSYPVRSIMPRLLNDSANKLNIEVCCFGYACYRRVASSIDASARLAFSMTAISCNYPRAEEKNLQRHREHAWVFQVLQSMRTALLLLRCSSSSRSPSRPPAFFFYFNCSHEKNAPGLDFAVALR